jgi:hypothetical protein
MKPLKRLGLAWPAMRYDFTRGVIVAVAILLTAATIAPGPALAGKQKFVAHAAGIQHGLGSESSPILQVQVFDITDWSSQGAPVRESATTPLEVGYLQCIETETQIDCQPTSEAFCDPRPDVQTKLVELTATLKGYFDCNNTYNFPPNVTLWVDLTWTLDHPPGAGQSQVPAAVNGTITDGTTEYLTTHVGYFLFVKIN